MANNRKHTGLICLIIVLGALLHNTGAQQEKSEGDDVFLKPQNFKVDSEVTWKKGNREVAHMNPKSTEKITYSFLKGRTTINETNGVLTIMDLTVEDTGLYKGVVVFVDGISYKTLINLTVHGLEEKLVGDYVILKPQYIRMPSEIIWRRGIQEVAHMKLSPQENVTYSPPLGDRADINRTNGALTIKNLIIEDSGLFEVSVNGTSNYTKINLIVYLVEKEEKFVGSDVVLKPKYSGALSEIKWRKGKQEVAHMKLSPQENVIHSPLFGGRADIDRTIGVLTIKNLTIEDSGDYKAEVVVNGTSQFTMIKLDVREDSCRTAWTIAGIGIGIGIAAVLYFFSNKQRVRNFVQSVCKCFPCCKGKRSQNVRRTAQNSAGPLLRN